MNTEDDNFPILHEEVEAAVKLLKNGKSAGVDNIPAELILREKLWPTPSQQDLAEGRLAYSMDTISGHHTSKKGNLQLCQNYQTISLISHQSSHVEGHP